MAKEQVLYQAGLFYSLKIWSDWNQTTQRIEELTLAFQTPTLRVWINQTKRTATHQIQVPLAAGPNWSWNSKQTRTKPWQLRRRKDHWWSTECWKPRRPSSLRWEGIGIQGTWSRILGKWRSSLRRLRWRRCRICSSVQGIWRKSSSLVARTSRGSPCTAWLARARRIDWVTPVNYRGRLIRRLCMQINPFKSKVRCRSHKKMSTPKASWSSRHSTWAWASQSKKLWTHTKRQLRTRTAKVSQIGAPT